MKRKWLILLVMAVLIGMTPAVGHAQSSARLQNADTTIRLEAGPSAPKLVDLKTRTAEIWRNRGDESLPHAIERDRESVPVTWRFSRKASVVTPSRVAFVYETAPLEPGVTKLRLTWEWEAKASFGPIEHRIKIENRGEQEVWLPFVDSLQLNWICDSRVQLEQFSVEKGEGAPSDEGVHLADIREGTRWLGTSSTYAHPEPGEPREIIPFLLVQTKDPTHRGWYAGIEFSGRTRIELRRNGSSLQAAVGLNPVPGPFNTRIAPGETFETPTVFLGGTSGGIDETGNALRRWIRLVLLNPADRNNPNFPTLTNNSWGSGMQIDEPLALRMLHDSAELQFEMFHIDAGWFRGVGDWHPDPKRFPHGLAAIADEAHRLGLKFGLWTDWTQAGLSAEQDALNVRDPKVRDWLLADTPADWKPEPFKGQTIDLGVPGATAWAKSETERIVSEYHLDMLEHDGYLVAQGCARNTHPHAPPDPANLRIRPAASSFWVESANETDVSYYATRAYYEVQATLRRNHPGLLLEICNDGGRMVDFGSASHGDYFSITDAYDPVANRRAFYDASHVLPAAMLETYVEKWPTPTIENFRYMLRSGMMGWLTVMTDTTAWTEAQHRTAKAEFELYKTRLRPLIRYADLYHISARPDGARWDAIEYFDPERREGVVYLFRGTTPGQEHQTFRLKGLMPDRNYLLHYQDGSLPDQQLSGRQLMTLGFEAFLPMSNASELVFIRESRR